MDKLTLTVLKFIASSGDNTSRKTILDAFGENAKKSLTYLETEGYIKSGRVPIGVGLDMTPVLNSNGIFNITSKGLAFLEEHPGSIYDKWSTRILAIWGAITGTAALVLEVVLHFL